MNVRSPGCVARTLALLLWVGVVAAVPSAHAQPTSPRMSESLVKAAMLHKFASFVEWPATASPRADAPLRIGVFGNEDMLHDLLQIAQDFKRDGRSVLVSRAALGESLGRFDVLYLKVDSPMRLSDILAQVPEGVLTVCEADTAPPRGCVLSFFIEDARVRFGASVEAATRQKLRLSPRLLAVAKAMPG